jgi:hypothetical protein
MAADRNHLPPITQVGIRVCAGASPHVNVGCRQDRVLAGIATDVDGSPLKRQRTTIGLDVHPRSIVARGLDGDTGELFERRLCPDHHEVLQWIKALPGPVAATYEAGPTGSVWRGYCLG